MSREICAQVTDSSIYWSDGDGNTKRVYFPYGSEDRTMMDGLLEGFFFSPFVAHTGMFYWIDRD